MKQLLLLLGLMLITLISYAQGEYKIKNIESNTEYSDFGLTFYQGDAVFASSRPSDNKSKKTWTNGQPFLDLYRATVNEETGELSDVRDFSDKIDTKYHESNAVFTKDQKTVYFTRNNYYKNHYGKDTLGWNNLKLFKAEVDEAGNWVHEQPLPFNNDNYSVGHPALSPDEKVLYFTSDMPGTLGQTDIFRVSINGDSYGNPENLGSAVNGPNREMFPYVSESGKLYYSTDKGGFGGLDIYMIETNNLTESPVQLSRPINSNLDDFCFMIDEQKHTGYFSSNRSGGKGDDDIYYFEELKSPEIACKQLIAGVVRDQSTGALLPGAGVVLQKDGQTAQTLVVGQDASFSFADLDCKASYKVIASKELYNGSDKIVKTTDVAGQTLNVVLQLSPNQSVIAQIEELDECQHIMDGINTIYFDLDKYNIRSDAAIELDKIVQAMQKCPDVKVIAGSHTDSRATDAYNIRLSRNRAQSTVDYIVQHGIMRNRLTAEGYGETQLVNHCSNGVDCTEAEHQQNRRTEFVIVRE